MRWLRHEVHQLKIVSCNQYMINVVCVGKVETLNSTVRIAPGVMNISPIRIGRYLSSKYGFTKTSKRSPVSPSIVSSKGSTWIVLANLTSGMALTETVSPSLKRKFERTTFDILILSSFVVSSDSTMASVSLRFLPRGK